MPQTAKAKYQAYLQTDCWEQTRLHSLQVANWICGRCFSAKATQVHHNTYARVGRERLEDLLPVCNKCHLKLHGLPPKAPKPANDNQFELPLAAPSALEPTANYSTNAMDKLARWAKTST